MSEQSLDPPGFGSALARPRLFALGCVLVLAAAGWLALGLMAGQASLIAALCRPALGQVPGLASILLILSMWGAMVLAMMLPTAAPTVATYADIAEAAMRKREPVVSPLVLIGGYLGVWLGFAAAATALQVMLVTWSPFDPSVPFASMLVSGALFVGAGLYQFSGLKHACLSKCRRPFSFLFANWTDRPAGVFRLGLRHGTHCVGCCWAMMSLMLAVGVMNVVWMAALGALMAIEKMSGPGMSRALGAGLIAAGVVMALMSIYGAFV